MCFLIRTSLAVNWLIYSYLSSILVAVLGTQVLLRTMMLSDQVLFPRGIAMHEV